MRSSALLLLAWSLASCSSPQSATDAGPSDAGRDAGAPDAGQDAGSDAGSCPRAPLTRPADIALLDALRAAVADAGTPADQQALVDAFVVDVADAGGTPLTDPTGTRVAFFWEGAPQVGYSVAGDWNNWTIGVDPLAQLGTTDLYVGEVNLPRTQVHAYKLADGSGNYFEDLHARNVVWDGIDHLAPGQFNELVYPELQDPTQGWLIAWRGVHSTVLNDSRDVFTYLPAAYDAPGCAVLPSIYFQDGNESLTRNPFQVAADQQYAQVPADSAVLVFVALPSQTVRTDQYTFGYSLDGGSTSGDAYLAFLRDDLRPKIEQAFRVCTTPKDRGLAGASLGGLISAYGAFQNPSVYGYVGAQSGSFFWDNDALITRAGQPPVVPVRFYLDNGIPNGVCDSSDNCDVTNQMSDVLSSQGYEVLHVQQDGGVHDWPYWQQRLPDLLHYFRQNRAGCGP